MSVPDSRPPAGASQRAQCAKHLVWHNQSTSSGCPVCLAEAARSAATGEAGLRWSPFRVTALASAAIALYFGGTNVIDAFAGQGQQIHEAARQTAGQLNPNTFRVAIEAVEQAVFDESAPVNQGSRISSAAVKLGEAISRAPAANMVPNSRRPQYTQAVLSFASRVSSAEDAGYGRFDAQDAREQWVEVRSEVFVGADWFTSAPAAARATLRPADPRPSPAPGPRALNDLTLDLENLLRFASSAMGRVGEPAFEDGTWEARKVESSWDEVRSALSGRLRSINASLPGGEVLLTARERDAHRYLEMCANEIAALSAISRVPWRSERQRILVTAQQYLEQATAVRQAG